MVDGLSGVDVSAHEVEFHGIGFECGGVEDVEFEGEGVVGEFGSDEVAGGEQRAKPHVAAVVAEAQVVA